MKNITVLLLLLLSFNIVAAQQKIIDSLKKELITNKADTNEVLLLAALSRAYYLFKPDTAIMLAQQAYTLAQNLRYGNGESLALNRIAAGYSTLGDYAKSLKFVTKALKISEDMNDAIGVARALNNLGDTYLTQGEYLKALNLFNKSKSFLHSLQLPSFTAITLLNIGMCYLHLHQYDSAFLYLQNSYKISKKNNLEDIYGESERGLGDVEAAKNNGESALAYFSKSISSYEVMDDKQGLSISYLSIAKLYQKQNKSDSSILYAKKALAAAQLGSYNLGILEASKTLSNLYEGKNDKEAFKYLKLATTAKDSLFSQDKVKQILSISFEEKQREQEMEAARNQARNQIKLFALLGILAVFLLLAIILYRNNRQKQKTNIVLQATLSNLKSTQTQLVQSEKMASLGELTAGIAHEIQNPLNFVNNFSEVNTELIAEMKSELEAGNNQNAIAIANDIGDNEQKINHHGKRADAIVKGMLQHSRSSTGEKELTNINTLADEYLRLSYHGLRAKDKSTNAITKTDFDDSIGKVNIVSQDVGRVLLNLFNNAFYAVNEKAKQQANGYEPTISVSSKRINDKVEVRVNDNGNGIPQKVLDKIFQPFFTTKPTGEGTGLGLSLSYDIIKAHGGEIKVKTKEGDGTEFIILLPIASVGENTYH